MSDIDLSEKFPDMKPIRSAPSLFRVNGCGTGVYGSRDHDGETGTYVTTYCISLIFIPVLALSAYRVANAQQGWYFIGKVPLSGFAKVWNCLILAFVLGLGTLGWWESHTHSPEYQAGKNIAEADRLIEANQAGKAAELYRDVIAGRTSHAAAAQEKLQKLLNEPPAALDQAAAVIQVAVDWQRQGNPPVVPDLVTKSVALAKQHADSDPRGAAAVLEAVAALAPDSEELHAERRTLLEKLVAQNPGDAELASRLAVTYESQKETDKCAKLLEPHAARLGTLEGARILGRLYAAEGKHEQAYGLLKPYTEGRLDKLHKAEQAYENAIKNAEDAVVKHLQSGKAPGFDYNKFKRSPDAAKQGMVREFVESRTKDDANIKKAQLQLMNELSVVPVALDLGIVMLYRAQGLPDAAERRKELEKAEQTFLAIRGIAGETDKYKLYLGQVYYWLAKHDEAKKLFDELLAAKNRNSEILVSVAQVYREVGNDSEARRLLEEAYKKETDQKIKYGIAVQRSLLWTDLDDEIAWLDKSNPDDPAVKASLSSTRGNKALQDGKDDEAAGHLRQAIDAYAKMAQNASTLNNCGLCYLSLFHATGGREHYGKGLEMLDRAVALKPDDTILLYNAANTILHAALEDIIGNAIDLKLLKHRGSFELLEHLHSDPGAKQKIVERVKKHPGVARARSYFEKLMVLAPKRSGPYSDLVEILVYTRDVEALRSVAQRLEKAELDLGESNRRVLDYYTGKDDAKSRKEMKTALDRAEVNLLPARKAGKVTQAVAAADMARLLLHGQIFMPTIDVNRIVALAEEAHTAAPSEATHSLRIMALSLKAHQGLIKQSPAYAELARKCDRSVGSTYLVAVALGNSGELRERTLANSDMQRALKYALEYSQKFPDERGPWSWALLRASQPAEASLIARRVADDPLLTPKRSIERQLHPLGGGIAISSCWMLLMAGKDTEAQAMLKQFADRGVPLPAEVH